MRKLFTAMALAIVFVPAGSARPKEWTSGTLVHFVDEQSGRQGNMTIYHITIRRDATELVGEARLGHNRRIPRFTENGPIRYAVEGHNLLVQGDDTRTMKFHLLKMRSN